MAASGTPDQGVDDESGEDIDAEVVEEIMDLSSAQVLERTEDEETHLIIIGSPYRSLTRPLLAYSERPRKPPSCMRGMNGPPFFGGLGTGIIRWVIPSQMGINCPSDNLRHC